MGDTPTLSQQMDLTCAAEFGRSALGQTTLDIKADAAANLETIRQYDLMDGEMVPELMCPDTSRAIDMMFSDPEAHGMDINEALIAIQNGQKLNELMAQPVNLLAQVDASKPENLLPQNAL